jgi:CheY-like chemotaxis protein
MEQKTIAVVDNDPIYIEFMHDALTEEGYHVVWCFTAAEVLALVQQTRPDLLMISIHIEYMEAGWDLIRLLRGAEATQHLSLIVCSGDRAFLSAHAQNLQAHRCLVLEKPFRLEVLLSLLHTAIG